MLHLGIGLIGVDDEQADEPPQEEVMAEQPCLPQVHAVRLRATKLDSNGVPSPGASSIYVTDAFIRVGASPVYTDGDEIEQKNAQGAVCINYRGKDSLKRLDMTVELCSPDPYLIPLLTGGTTLTGFDGQRVGMAMPPIGLWSGSDVSIEVWSKRIDDGVEDADSPYAWHVYPRVTNLRMGDLAHENGPFLPTCTGQAYENPNWFDGPTNDWPAASDRVYQWVPTDTLPTVQCGFQTLTAS